MKNRRLSVSEGKRIQISSLVTQIQKLNKRAEVLGHGLLVVYGEMGAKFIELKELFPKGQFMDNAIALTGVSVSMIYTSIRISKNWGILTNHPDFETLSLNRAIAYLSESLSGVKAKRSPKSQSCWKKPTDLPKHEVWVGKVRHENILIAKRGKNPTVSGIYDAEQKLWLVHGKTPIHPSNILAWSYYPSVPSSIR